MNRNLIPINAFRSYILVVLGESTYAVPESHRNFIHLQGYNLGHAYEVELLNEGAHIIREIRESSVLTDLCNALQNQLKNTAC